MNAKRARRTAGKTQSGKAGPACPSCGTATVVDAVFCHACGTSLSGGASSGGISQRALIGLAIIAVIVAGGVFALSTFTGQQQAAIPGPGPMTPAMPQVTQRVAPPSGSVAGVPPDLSTMTPREAADRLFNRIMGASEQGRQDEAQRFVPMAVQAYANLQNLDRDAHYHLALIHGVADDKAARARHIAALRDGAPNHLLALTLEHAIAKKAGDSARLEEIVTLFREAYAAEMALQRREYVDHRNTIERFRAETAK